MCVRLQANGAGTMSSVRRVMVAEEMNARHRPTMEDTYVVADALGGDAATGYFAVYDGHGGAFVACVWRCVCVCVCDCGYCVRVCDLCVPS